MEIVVLSTVNCSIEMVVSIALFFRRVGRPESGS